jgi:hypothetical protein
VVNFKRCFAGIIGSLIVLAMAALVVPVARAGPLDGGDPQLYSAAMTPVVTLAVEQRAAHREQVSVLSAPLRSLNVFASVAQQSLRSRRSIGVDLCATDLGARRSSRG